MAKSKMIRITFEEQLGRLRFNYCGPEGTVSDWVPTKLAEEGSNNEIRKYVINKARKIIREQEQKGQQLIRTQEIIKKTNISISVTYNGMKLKGRITHNDGGRGGIVVTLEKPKALSAQDTLQMCFALAMGGKQIFLPNGKVAPWAVERAKELLAQIYHKQIVQNRAKILNTNTDIAD